MSAATSIVRWDSTRDASRCGYEIAGFAPRRHRLQAELDQTLTWADSRKPAFVFMVLDGSGPDDIATSISRAAGFSHAARICLAIDEETFGAADPSALRDANVGVVLDQVDASTPLSVLSSDLVEAVRFTQAFVEHAMADARSACVLTAMLRLAHDLGLATLASTSDGKSPAEFEFEYVVAASTAARSGQQGS